MTKFPHYIYLIRAVDGFGPIKIGVTYNLDKRLSVLMGWSPFPLEIVASFPGSFVLERQIHDCLWRSHSHREWFHPTAEVLEFADAMAKGVPVDHALDLNIKFRTRYASKYPVNTAPTGRS